MRRAIIHIGMPRTGSTSVQHILAALRDELGHAGIIYPDLTPLSVHEDRHISHQHLGETLDNRRPRYERQELLRKLSDFLADHDGDTVFLSYEDFIQQQRRFRVPEILNDFFVERGFIPEAVVVAKPQSEHLNSIYTHRAQMIREYQSFAEFAQAYTGAQRFEYDALIAPWMTAFAGRVRAVPVHDRRTDAPIILRLLKELELDARVVPLLRADDLKRVENRSAGPVAVEISRRMRTMRMHAQLRVIPRQVMRFVEQQTAKRGFDRDKFYGVPQDMRDRMEARYRQINERFARIVWGKGWDDVVAPEPIRPVNELATTKITPDEERTIQGIIGLAAKTFEVTLQSSIFDMPINRLIANVAALQRRIGYSRWRVQ